jgi:hypothetical protein
MLFRWQENEVLSLPLRRESSAMAFSPCAREVDKRMLGQSVTTSFPYLE